MSNTDQGGGYGQLTPYDTYSDFNVISFMTRQMLAQLSTMKLVQITAVHTNGTFAAPGTVDVMPLVNQIDGQGNSTPHGVVYGIPWFRYQAGTTAIICDPVVGDVGYVVVSDRDISSVKSTGKQANPGSRRTFDLSDGVYVGGLFGKAPTNYIYLNPQGGFTLQDQFGNQFVSSSSGWLLKGNLKVQGTLEATQIQTDDNGLAVTGNITATGTIKGNNGASFVGLTTHEHPGNNTPPTPGI